MIGFQETYSFSVVIDLDALPVSTNGTTEADYEFNGGSLDVGGLSVPLASTTVMVRDNHGGPPFDSYFAGELETPDPFELNGGVSFADMGAGGLPHRSKQSRPSIDWGHLFVFILRLRY